MKDLRVEDFIKDETSAPSDKTVFNPMAGMKKAFSSVAHANDQVFPMTQSKADLHRVVHLRISSYFKLYTNFLNFETYCLLAHRDRITVFDLTNEVDEMLVQQF